MTGDFEDLPGLIVERYGPLAIFQLTQEREKLTASLRDLARWYREMLGVPTVYVKRNIRSARPMLREEITDPKPLIGKPLPQELEIDEHVASKQAVVKDKIDEVVVFIESEALLAGFKKKAFAEFEQEMLETVDDRGFEV